MIGHMKTDGLLGRNWLKGALGDTMHEVLCGAGQNLRMILAHLRVFCCALISQLMLAMALVVPTSFASATRARR
jgi:IS5 family transposase